ncbi:MAG: leucine-rich repeat domain-containing protein [Lachnospiraceae bacterium]|nr:leucine-rich repeat domain-containing protein [Lachnospiraceae bacterium]
MKSNQFKYNYKFILFFCAVLCSTFFCACGQQMEPPQDKVVTLSETVDETAETKEAEEITAGTEETAIMPDLSEAGNADEALALLIEDEGFRERVRYGTDIEEEDLPEAVLQKLENCEGIVLKEAAYGNAIYSLESLSLLPNLKMLVIDIDQWDDSVIADFTPIAQLSQLENLYISYGKDEQVDLSFLGEMSTITELFLIQCTIEDFSFLGKMPQLQCLSLYETPIEDLAVLEKLPELVELSISGNENAKNIEAVGTLTKMQDLGMQYCGIEDIGFLSGLTELRGVNLNGNAVTDITPLADLDKLERLGLSENRISDISVIENMSNLFDLALDGNEIQDISVLAKLPHLNQVGISDNQIEDLSPLAGNNELMYVAVFGNPVKSIEPLFDVPMLLYTGRGVSDEEKAFIADWLAEHYPEAIEFECIDFIQGDLNNDGRQDIAFVVDSAAFEIYEQDRRLFILLQQKDGSWVEQADTPQISSSWSGGMRGDPYYGVFMQDGYLIIKEGWGSSSGTVQKEIYEYRNGSLSLVKQISVDDCNYADGYDVRIQDERTGTWKRYAIAMDGYRMVRVDLADSEHVTHKAFPEIDLFHMSYYIHEQKIESQITSGEALDRVLEAAVEDVSLAVQEKLPYAKWQKEGHELLLGVTLPDYYYVFPETQKKAETESEEWAGDYLYYDGMIGQDGKLYHVICLEQEQGEREFRLDDATGEIKENE